MATKLRFLSADDLQKCLPMSDAVEGMKSAFAQFSAGKCDVPLRTRVTAGCDGMTLVMPVHLQESNDLAVKVVSCFPNNPAAGLPFIHALVFVIDADTGKPLAIMEGGTLTAIRTGAGSGAATDILASPNASTVAIIGSGVQAKTQLQAVCEVRDITQVYVYSNTRANAEVFASEMAGKGRIPSAISVSSSANDAVRDADIICAATTSKKPVFDGKSVKVGAHVNGVGSFCPDMQELDPDLLARACIVVDSRESVLSEAGEIIVALQEGVIEKEDIFAELGEIVLGAKKREECNKEVTFFKSVGVAVQDASAAAIALRNAEANDIGTIVDM